MPTPARSRSRRPADLNALPLPRLYRALAADGLVDRLLTLARDEDLGIGEHAGDITSVACVDVRERAVAAVVARDAGVVAGLATVPAIVKLFAPDCRCTFAVRDGASVKPGATLATLRGPLRQILGAERTLLNLVSRLSGIATRTRAFLHAMHAGPTSDPAIRARLYDTRKTTPGLRVLEKYAVRCGGGHCHRIGLHDAVLIKDNHIASVRPSDLAERVAHAAEVARTLRPGLLRFVEVEVDTLEQFEAIVSLPAGVVNIVLLDNMEPRLLRKAARLRDARQPTLELESSGGITLKTIRAKARTGVDRLSVGSLTHGAASIDIGLDVRG
ncbi:MAG: carboxylating nicotinate-nucleotide diphosphorylase [Planctomycetota bacterium]|nr:carboxylating nicotinate-nucleotide diphosphorylase [Planctomycetota bacterium]